MKIALLNDIHFGCRNNNIIFHHAHIFRFYKDVFFPYLKSNPDIRDVWVLGDFVENRKVINFQTIRWVNNNFFEEARSLGLKLHALAGNHDCFYRESNVVNVYREIWKDEFETIIDQNPVEWNGIAIIPWINENNKEYIQNWISKTKLKYVFGHLEMLAAKGIESQTGSQYDSFKKFKKVITGHYHEKILWKNIIYLGTQYDITWAEACEDGVYKGFHIFDTETGDLTFIKNPVKCHIKIFYDDTNKIPMASEYDVKDKVLKIIIKNKKSNGYFQRFVDELSEQMPISLSTFDESQMFISDYEMESDQTIYDDKTLIQNYIQNMNEINLDKNVLLDKTLNLYQRAKEIGKL